MKRLTANVRDSIEFDKNNANQFDVKSSFGIVFGK